jgi:hypothetical protein
MISRLRKGVRVVEGARLERVYTGNCIVGSNPTLSATSRSRLSHNSNGINNQTLLKFKLEPYLNCIKG